MNTKLSILALTLIIFTSNFLIAQADFFDLTDQFFRLNIEGGAVNYQKIKEKPQLLHQLIDSIRHTNIDTLSDNKRKAYLINAYNLVVIYGVVDKYPIDKPTDIDGFFDRNKVSVFGKEMTLNQLEKNELLKEFKDARLHFVLVCAAKSCPSIASFSYKPEIVEIQLTQQTQKALQDSLVFYYDEVSKKIYLSRIFDWYVDDFKPNVLRFINQYSNLNLSKKSRKIYLNYNWNLNDASKEISAKGLKNDFAPIIVAATLPKKTFEINLFNNVFTANYEYNNSRSTYFTGFYQFGYGLTGNIDLGLDLLLKSNKVNDDFKSSPLRVFEFRRGTELVRESDSLQSLSDFGLTHIGPRIRWSPFKKIALSFEQGIYAPIPAIPAGKNFDKAWYWVTQFYYDYQFNTTFGIFAALTFWQPIIPQQQFKLQVPFVKIFFSWYATSRFTMYATTTSLTEWGVGLKYLVHPNFEIQALYTYYVPIPGIYNLYVGDALNVMTFNLGLRYRFTFNEVQN